MPTKIFIVVKECSDPWYGSNPEGTGFTREEDAVTYATKLNGGPNEDEGLYDGYHVQAITLDPEATT